MRTSLQLFILGISMGSVYALFAVSFTLLISVMRVLNFAHGQLLMLGAFAALAVDRLLNLGVWVGLVAAVLAAAGAAVLIERLIFRPVLARQHRGPYFFQELAGVVGTIGAAIVLTVGVQMITGGEVYSYSRSFAGLPSVANVGGMRLPLLQLAMAGVAVVLVLALWLFLQRTEHGIAIRATAADPGMAEALGIRRDRVFASVFALAGGLAGATGLAIALSTQTIAHYAGGVYLLKAFVAVVIGGLGDQRGAVVGGLTLGLLEAFVGHHASAITRDVVVFALLFLVILARPQGLLGAAHAQARA